MNWTAMIQEAAKTAGRPLDPDVVEELATHAQAAFDAACARGFSVDDAETHVRGLIDTMVAQATALRRRPRTPPPVLPPPAGTRPLAGALADVRYAGRLLVRQRSFAAVATLTMALAIGVMTTLFSVAYAVLLKPLPWPEPDRLVRLSETHVGATRQMPLTMSNISFLPWSDHPETIEALGGWSKSLMTLGGVGDADRLAVAAVTPGTFAMLKIAPIAGSTFSSDRASEVVLSYGLWQERFGGELSAIGRTLQLNGASYAIVGIMPRGFLFPDRDTRLWRPLVVPPPVSPDGKSTSVAAFSAMARLKPGVSPERASAEATARARLSPDGGRAALALFGSNGPADVTAAPVLDALTREVRPALIALLVAVSLLLLTAIANIASLQLARATTRHRELAIRSAIGAGTARLVQQLFIENLVLAAIGGALGLALSLAAHRLLPALLPADFPRIDDIAFTGTVAWFALALTALTGLLLGVLPAWHLRRLRLVDALAENAGGNLGGTRVRTRAVIMAGQVAIASALLVGGILLMRSFVAMLSHDRGFEADHVLTARLSLPDFAFAPDARLETLETFVERAQALPGATTLAVTTGMPLSGSENLTGFDMPSLRPPVGTSMLVHAVRSVVTPGYFTAIGMRLAQGRLFRPDDDSAAAPRVVIVNRTFAKQYLTEAAVGDRIRNFMRGDNIDFEVIGVVEDVMRRGLQDATQPEIFSLLRQSTGPSTTHDVVVRTTGDPLRLAQPLRALVKQIAPAGTLDSIHTMDDRISASLARPRLYAVLLVVFAVSALAIAAVGLFGVLSYTVAQRTREIALRAALGADPARIVGLIVRYGVGVTVAGLAAGVGLALATMRSLTTLLYGVSASDVSTFVLVVAVMLVVALAACLVPALRALRIDPMSALRA